MPLHDVQPFDLPVLDLLPLDLLLPDLLPPCVVLLLYATPYVQPFDLPVVDLLLFDLLRPDLLPPCVVLLFRLHLLTCPLSLDRGLPSFYTMILSSLLLRLFLRTLGCGISDCP